MRTREELWARLRELQADLPVIDDFDDVEVFPEEGCKSALHALVREERGAVWEEAAKVAASVVDGYSANIRESVDEQELVRDPNGPWVLNSDVAAALRARARAREEKP